MLQFSESIQQYKKLVGFVPQDDIMHRDLTVYENLLFNAKARLPSNKSRQEIRDIVLTCIDVLGLMDVRDSIIGDENVRGISGGQRKRVNIGIVRTPCAKSIPPSHFVQTTHCSGARCRPDRFIFRRAYEWVGLVIVEASVCCAAPGRCVGHQRDCGHPPTTL
jgi:hypothetical protein